MIHIADTKIARRYGDYFIRQINKIDEVGPIFSFLHIMLLCYFLLRILKLLYFNILLKLFEI